MIRKMWYRFLDEVSAYLGDYEGASAWLEKGAKHKTVRIGSGDWEDLMGETFRVLFSFGFGDTDWVEVSLKTIRKSETEFGTPVYYLEGEHGGYRFYETELVKVRFD